MQIVLAFFPHSKEMGLRFLVMEAVEVVVEVLPFLLFVVAVFVYYCCCC